MSAVRPAHVETPAPGVSLEVLLQGLEPEAADALLRECLAEAALRRHLQRIHDSRYASDTPQPRELFRVA